jgi:prepilin-type N-terminal cleavage/methylation domain-containing protein
MTATSLARRGFTLVELLLALIVTAIVGAALVRMVVSQTRFMDQQEAWRGARSVARGGINRLLSDLRAVEAANGVEAAVAGGQDFTIRVPYAFGVLCGITAGNVYTLSLLPVDSAMFAAPGLSGIAWRNAAGAYTYSTGITIVLAGTTALCQNGAYDSVHTIPTFNGSPAGRVVNIVHAGGAIPGPVPPRGSIFFVFRRIRYEFKNSAALPGRTGLWRTMVTTGDSEELATPFANTARVNFYVLNTATAQSAVPGTLGDIRGLELVLDGMSERTPGGSTAPKTANVVTSVFFENRPD